MSKSVITPEHREWLDKHKDCKLGQKTPAFYGVQWGNTSRYVLDKCGCGSTFTMRTPKSVPEIYEPEEVNETN